MKTAAPTAMDRVERIARGLTVLAGLVALMNKEEADRCVDVSEIILAAEEELDVLGMQITWLREYGSELNQVDTSERFLERNVPPGGAR